MGNVNNEFLTGRSVKFTAVLSSVATTVYSGHIIPAGAIVTGIRYMLPGARTIAGNATWGISVGTTPLVAVSAISDLGAQTIPTAYALLTAGGIYIAAAQAGELKAVAQASAGIDATINIYVDYIYV